MTQHNKEKGLKVGQNIEDGGRMQDRAWNGTQNGIWKQRKPHGAETWSQ